MKTHDIKNLPMSVHDRLRNLAQLRNRPYQELLTFRQLLSKSNSLTTGLLAANG